MGSGSRWAGRASPDRLLRGRPDRARGIRWASTWPGSTCASATTWSSAACFRLFGREQRQGAGLEELRQDRARLQRPLLWRALRDPAPAGPPVPEPGPPEGRPAAHLAEHDRQLHHEHELAVLRRRVHDVVPDADGRARRCRTSSPPAVGMAVLAAVVRGIARRSIGDARQLLARPLPVARLHPAAAVDRARRDPHLAGRAADVQRARDCARRSRARTRRSRAARSASQIAIKQLGTNGGGYYNSNSAVPFENPTGLSNFLEMLAILLIPAAQVFMFGRMVLARTARVGGVRVDVRRLRDRHRDQPARGAARLARARAARA